MCVSSAVGDYWREALPGKPYYPGIQPIISQPIFPTAIPEISRFEFDALKRDVEELKKLLAAAKEFDAKTGEADCEHEDKIALIRKVAKLVGVSMDDVLGKS